MSRVVGVLVELTGIAEEERADHRADIVEHECQDERLQALDEWCPLGKDREGDGRNVLCESKATTLVTKVRPKLKKMPNGMSYPLFSTFVRTLRVNERFR
jgi:hypothetical protein